MCYRSCGKLKASASNSCNAGFLADPSGLRQKNLKAGLLEFLFELLELLFIFWTPQEIKLITFWPDKVVVDRASWQGFLDIMLDRQHACFTSPPRFMRLEPCTRSHKCSLTSLTVQSFPFVNHLREGEMEFREGHYRQLCAVYSSC